MSEHRPPASPSPPGNTYARGDSGPAVAEIRAKLAMLGLLAEGEGAELLDPAGALFDEATDRAVRAGHLQGTVPAQPDRRRRPPARDARLRGDQPGRPGAGRQAAHHRPGSRRPRTG